MKSSNLSQALETFSHETRKINLPKSDEANLQVSIANNIYDRTEAYNLLYQVYLEKEFTGPLKTKLWYSLFEAHENTITIIVKDNEEIVGALTVVHDTSWGLPIDQIFQDEMNTLRSAHRAPAEIISLGIKKNARGAQEILIKLFNYSYIASKYVYHATDFVITVNPRHTFFYIKKLYFHQIGEPKAYHKVGGADAVMLMLDLDFVDSVLNKPELVPQKEKAI